MQFVCVARLVLRYIYYAVYLGKKIRIYLKNGGAHRQYNRYVSTTVTNSGRYVANDFKLLDTALLYSSGEWQYGRYNIRSTDIMYMHLL